jgi:hypothetical protein
MAFLRMVVRSFALVGLASAWLQAQSTHARVVVAPQGRPRIASIAPPPPAQSLTTYGQTVFQTSPVIVTPDGRVLVDLGDGYEQVARTCPYEYGYGCQSNGYPIAPQTPIFSSYLPPGYVPPRYAPPAYGAPYYPTPTYPAGGYGYYPGYQPGYGPYYQPSAPSYGGCPPGYVPTGSYPPCIDPYVAPVTSTSMPASGAVRAAPTRQPPAARVLLPRVHR